MSLLALKIYWNMIENLKLPVGLYKHLLGEDMKLKRKGSKKKGKGGGNYSWLLVVCKERREKRVGEIFLGVIGREFREGFWEEGTKVNLLFGWFLDG